jgi:hypothetical protein
MTRHPRKGAAQQLLLVYRNQKEIRDLQNFRRSGAPEVPICELVENKEQQLKKKLSRRSPHGPLVSTPSLRGTAS